MPFAALIGVFLALQALVGGFGTGAMAFASNEAVIICASGDMGYGAQQAINPDAGHGEMQGSDQPRNAKHAKDCCLSACQVAAAVHVGMPAKLPESVAVTAVRSATLVVVLEANVAPRQLGLSGDARGPPVLPV